jgi:hypothetical protein
MVSQELVLINNFSWVNALHDEFLRVDTWSTRSITEGWHGFMRHCHTPGTRHAENFEVWSCCTATANDTGRPKPGNDTRKHCHLPQSFQVELARCFAVGDSW